MRDRQSSAWISTALVLGIWALLVTLVACAPAQQPLSVSGGSPGQTSLRVLAVETFLSDIAQNVAGDRLHVEALVPAGVDPHSFEPVPSDVRKVADCNVLIVNGAGLEQFLNHLLQNAGGTRLVVEASTGLTSRLPEKGEAQDEDHAHRDPHFWLDPNNVVTYVQNIREGLQRADPDGAAEYAAHADAYIRELEELDHWVAQQVSEIPQSRRLLVTNHESFGYFADRYGFTVVGTVIPSLSTDAVPSAQDLSHLVDRMRELGVKAIFLETGSNPELAHQVARETGIHVVTELYTHSPSRPGGPAPTYLDMVRFNTSTIIAALK